MAEIQLSEQLIPLGLSAKSEKIHFGINKTATVSNGVASRAQNLVWT